MSYSYDFETGNRNLINASLHVVLDKDMEACLKIKGHDKSFLNVFWLPISI